MLCAPARLPTYGPAGAFLRREVRRMVAVTHISSG
jgi:hypothetical protein